MGGGEQWRAVPVRTLVAIGLALLGAGCGEPGGEAADRAPGQRGGKPAALPGRPATAQPLRAAAAQPDRKTAARQWLAALASGDDERAIELAHRLVPRAPKPRERYRRIFRRHKLNPEVLAAGFNSADVQRWRNAAFFQQQATEIVAAHPERAEIVALFAAVRERIAPHEPDKATIVWPRVVWERRAGLCDRMVWVLCELAWQRGWQTSVVYLYHSAEMAVSPHTICELRRGERVYVADPLTGALLADTSIAELQGDAAVQRRIWPDTAEWRRALAHAVLYLPAFAQDYCPRNQVLYAALRQHLPAAEVPRFGQDPRLRAARYARHLATAGERDMAERLALWPYPLQLLVGQHLRDSGAIPAP